MPLRTFQCSICGTEINTLKKEAPLHCNTATELVITAPSVTALETVDPAKNTKRMKNQQKILKERARNHSRDNDLHDMIQVSKGEKLTAANFLNKSGKKRTKFDDI